MPLKANIHFLVPAAQVHQKAAREFFEFIETKRLCDDLYTVICYPGMRGESTSIVDSKTLSKAISKTSDYEEIIVAVAHNFTSEALELLNSLNGITFCRSSHYWSDASWADIRDKK